MKHWLVMGLAVGIWAPAVVAQHAAQFETVYYVAADPDPLDYPGSSDEGIDGETAPPPIAGWDCDAFDQCGPIRLLTSAGTYGCGTGCTGTCRMCSGSNNSATLCFRSPASQCFLGPPKQPCGTRGNGTCGTTGPGSADTAGCFCTPPATCQIWSCLVSPEP